MTLTPPLVRSMTSTSDAAAFYELNRRWLTELFTITEKDEQILLNPGASVVEPGGEVLVAADEDGTVVGVVAVLATAPGVYELAKMTVDESARGRGIGALLIDAAVEWARARGAHLVFLGSNSRLIPAIRLYEQAGFTHTTLEDLQLVDYHARADVFMKLPLA